MDNADLEECNNRHVTVPRLEAGNAVQVAERTMMLMLAALRRLAYFDRRTKAGDWLRPKGRATHRQFAGKTIGIIGLGAIGRQIAR